MKDQYVGDVGDFGKYGLLRYIVRDERLRPLFVAWWATPDVPRTDGKIIGYLAKRDEYRPLDPVLFDTLARLVGEGRRSMAEIESSGLLGPDARFFRAPVPTKAGGMGARTNWIDNLLAAASGAGVVFLDPDNGIRTARTLAPDPTQHVLLDEVKRIVDAGHAVVAYHHPHRGRDHASQIGALAASIRKAVGPDARVSALRFKRYQSRAFFAVAATNRGRALNDAFASFVETPWNSCFELVVR